MAQRRERPRDDVLRQAEDLAGGRRVESRDPQVASPSSAAARMRCVMAIVASTPAADQPSTARTQPSEGTEQMASTSGAWTNQARS